METCVLLVALMCFFVGDFWQLDPPRGGFLANIPVEFIRRARKYDPRPDAAHGEQIFWGSEEHAVQGITELTECMRTDDKWLHELQPEMRDVLLYANNWNFLHGRPTPVPGSWCNGHKVCGNAVCTSLKGSTENEDRECDYCKQERADKCRVIKGFNDDRLRQPNFINALPFSRTTI